MEIVYQAVEGGPGQEHPDMRRGMPLRQRIGLGAVIVICAIVQA